MLYNHPLNPDTSTTITFLSNLYTERMIVVGDGDGVLTIQSNVAGEWVGITSLPPAYATHVNVFPNTTLRFVTTGNISATIQVLTREIIR